MKKGFTIHQPITSELSGWLVGGTVFLAKMNFPRHVASAGGESIYAMALSCTFVTTMLLSLCCNNGRSHVLTVEYFNEIFAMCNK